MMRETIMANATLNLLFKGDFEENTGKQRLRGMF